ncbi:MAG: VWA domain-containing protein [Acidobacteria bacterium]|nr:VWA domain-containing protein [Acidobacteriota bacterium]
MRSAVVFLLFLTAMAAQNPPPQTPAPKEETAVFRSDVALARVDVQVLDRNNRALDMLQARDFILRENGRKVEIRNFLREEMPLDVLFLFDVSGSMNAHVRRVTEAAQNAFRILNEKDRVAVMVFDRATRTRMAFQPKDAAEREFRIMMRQERFNGGTDITRALLDAADYVGRKGRREARRAIIIVTDDETEFNRDEERVGRALANADAVLMALLAPDAMRYMSQDPRGYPGGGNYPGGRYPQRRGGIILGPTYPGGGGYPGGGYPGGGGGYPRYPQGGTSRTQSAGTAEIARESGGDSLPVEHASALEDILERIRNRYALHFLLPGGLRAGQQRSISVELADAMARRFPDADLRYRRTYIVPADSGPSDTVTSDDSPRRTDDDPDRPVIRRGGSTTVSRRTSVGEPGGGGTRGPNPNVGAAADGTPAAKPADTTAGPARTGPGWRKVKPEELPENEPAKKQPDPPKENQ